MPTTVPLPLTLNRSTTCLVVVAASSDEQNVKQISLYLDNWTVDFTGQIYTPTLRHIKDCDHNVSS